MIQEYACSAQSACTDGVATGLSIVKQGKRSSYFDYNRKGYLNTVHTDEPPVYEKDIRVVSSLYEMQGPCQATVASFWKVLQVRVRDDAAF